MKVLLGKILSAINGMNLIDWVDGNSVDDDELQPFFLLLSSQNSIAPIGVERSKLVKQMPMALDK